MSSEVLRISDLGDDIRKEIYDHVFGEMDLEVGGVLVGKVDETGKPTVDGIIAALRAENGSASVTFTHEAWTQIIAVQDSKFRDSPAIIGWYLSHPGFGISLSENDAFIHRNFFKAPFHVAYVIDPQRGREGMFVWRGDELVLVEPESATSRANPSSQRLVVAAADLEDDPPAAAPGRGVVALAAPAARRARLHVEIDDGPTVWYRRRRVIGLLACGLLLLVLGAVLFVTAGSPDTTITHVPPPPPVARGADLGRTRSAIGAEERKAVRYEGRQQAQIPPPPPPPPPPPVVPPPVVPPPVVPPPVVPPPPPPPPPSEPPPF